MKLEELVGNDVKCFGCAVSIGFAFCEWKRKLEITTQTPELGFN